MLELDDLNLHIQYITNDLGEKTAVILPITEFEELLEDLEDLKTIADRKDEETISHEAVIAELKEDDIL
ncbi:hypothetical protein cce_0361 [Crocosphaera subtropica ATCC 51142]|uniref:Antitoxin n=1 Tax=Crocosphaera subtropica (strain ATCC 51142 / BH68) TaxID=43989 RepID=B1X171_CROS5|nr:hypothetical protein [Crocosphaera subtropica]ACB49712.1 hypothetical protein cce_0361 [Crocosphaera subtropica ATCC 51142]